MFGRSKPVVFEDSYNRRRSRLRVPRWLVLLLLGVAAGAAGVVYVQEQHLPPRLSAAEGAQLRAAFEQADGERQRLQAEMAQSTRALDEARAENKRIADELAADRQAIDRLRDDAAFIAAALPPDPRGGQVEVRAARFSRAGNALAYEVALVREGARGKPLPGVIQLVLSGDSARGGESTVALESVALSVGTHQIVRGEQKLPEGFAPRQCTIRVLDRPGGQLLGTRVMLVR